MAVGVAVQQFESHRLAGRPGESDTIALKVDHVVLGPEAAPLALAAFQSLKAEHLHPELTLVCAERIPAWGGFESLLESRELLRAAERSGAWFSRAGNGRGDAVHLERFGAPGKLVLGVPHVPSCGALGSLPLSGGMLEAAAVMAGEPLWSRPLDVVTIRLTGGMPSWVSGQDLAFELLRRLPSRRAAGSIVELSGPGVSSVTMTDRLAVARQASMLGARAIVFPSDTVTRRFLNAHGREADWKPLEAGEGTPPGAGYEVDLETLEPMVARREPLEPRLVRHVTGTAVTRILFGSLATFEDLERLRGVLSGSTVHAEVDVHVLPGSLSLVETGASTGLWSDLGRSGVRTLGSTAGSWLRTRSGPSGTGLCFGAGPNDVVDRGTRWYVASPETCAAAAVTGRITDPRELEGTFRRDVEPERYVFNGSWLVRPSGERGRSGASSPLVAKRILDGPLRGVVLLKLEDHVLGELIVPRGARATALGSRLEELADHAFGGRDPGFAARARAHGGGWVVAGRAFAAGAGAVEGLVLAALAVRAVIAKSFDPLVERELVHAGVLPLCFARPEHHAAIEAGDELELPGVPDSLEPGCSLAIRNLTRGEQYTLRHGLTAREIAMVREGGLLHAGRS